MARLIEKITKKYMIELSEFELYQLIALLNLATEDDGILKLMEYLNLDLGEEDTIEMTDTLEHLAVVLNRSASEVIHNDR